MASNRIKILLLLAGFTLLCTCIKVKDEMMVTTGEVTNIQQNSAEASGMIVELGTGVTEHGHCYAKTPNASINNLKTTLGIPAGNGGFTSPLPDLEAGTKYYIKAYLSNGKDIVYGKEISFSTLAALLPEITTKPVTDITQQGANSGGNIKSDGGAPVTARGVCWNTASVPTISNNKTTEGNGSGIYSSNLTGLSLSTTYYVRAYATNSTGTGYGNEIYFTTAAGAVIPPVTTTDISAITINSAFSGGTISNDGGAPVTDRGVCWSTTINPTIASFKTSNGTGIGNFSGNLTGLNSGTTYYVRAFATNNVGTGYGNQLTFTTSSDIPVVTTSTITSVTGTTASGGGNIATDGGAAITARGVCWSTSANPTVSNSKTNDGAGTGSFSSNLAGLNPATLYYVRAYATNSEGTAYGDQVSFTTSTTMPSVTTAIVSAITATTSTCGGNVTSDGGASVTARGVCWNTAPGTTTSNSKTSDGSGTGTFISSLTGLNANTTYYIRAYATNSLGTAYGTEYNFKTSAGLPSVTTASVTSITETTAISGGNVINDGGASISARGVCWSTSPNPTLTNSLTDNGTGTGSFVSNLTGLMNKTTYYVRAYATNSSGTGYGNEISFTTSSLPVVTTYTVSNISGNSATSGGNISDDGGTAVIARGVCWSISQDPVATGTHTTDGSGSGSFDSNITGLQSNTTYYVRAYATNSAGIAYGAQKSFTTNIVVTDIDGNAYNTVKIGTQLWTRENLEVTHYRDGSPIAMVTDNNVWNSLGTGAYCNYNNEENNVITYGRIYNFYAIDDNRNLCPVGWHLPSDAEWSTLTTYLGGIAVAGGKMKETGTTHWSSPNAGATNESGFNALPGGNRANDGTFTGIGDVGVWWSSTEYSTNIAWHRDVVYNGSNVNINNSYEVVGFSVRCIQGEVTKVIPTLTTTGISLITAYTASSGGNITSDGGAFITERGICWSTIANPTINDNKTTNGTGPGIFTSDLNDLSPATTYYVRAYATNKAGTAYGNELSITTTALFPTLTTIETTLIKAYSASSGGDITNNGGATITARGVCWSTSQNPTVTNDHTANGGGSGSYTSNITGLSPLTTYFVRAYATNSAGTAYGNEINFITSSNSPPAVPTGVYATPADKAVTNKWNTVSYATSYNIYWSTSPGVSKTNFTGKISDITTTSYLHTGLTSGTIYYYVVTSKNDYGESIESNYAKATVPLLLQTNTISASGEKQYYQVSISSGQSLFVNINIADDRNIFYLYVKHGSLPTITNYDTLSVTGEDEAISIKNAQTGTYYIMVYASSLFCDYNGCASGDYTITASTGVTALTFGISTAWAIIHSQEKDYYEVTVSSGQSLFVNTHNADNRNDFYLYAKYGSLPTTSVYDAKSETGEDEAISITNTQSGTYYIMVFAISRYCDYNGCAPGDFTITAISSKKK
jgi:uncharacterized protein (TIGR02145 family)